MFRSVRAFFAEAIAWLLQWRPVRAYLRYAEHHGPGLADGITYRSLFSLFAGLLLSFSVAALWLGGRPDAMQALETGLDRVIPGVTAVVDLSRINAPTSFTLIGIVSLLGLVAAAIGAITSLRTALRILADDVWEDGMILWVLLRNLLVAIGLGLLLALAAALSGLSAIGARAVASWFGISASGWTIGAMSDALWLILVLVIDSLAVAFAFRALSGVRAPTPTLWAGAVLGGLGLVVLQTLSGLFVRGATANPLLASFAALVALLLWFNLSAQVILYASTYIIVGTAEAHDRMRERHGATTLAQYRRQRAEDRLRAASRDLRAAVDAEREEPGPGHLDHTGSASHPESRPQ